MKNVSFIIMLLYSVAIYAQLQVFAPAYPPMVIYDSDSGQVSGIATDVVNQLAKDAAIEIDIKVLPWSNAYNRVRYNKNVMLYPVIRTPEREYLFHWIGPVNKFHYGIYSLKPIEGEIESLSHLNGSRVGVLRGGVDSIYLKSKGYPNIIEGNSIDLLIVMLIKGRIEYLMVDDNTLKYYLQQSDLSKLTKVYRHLSLDDVTDDPYSYVVLNKQSDPIYLERLKKSMKKMRESGVWTSLSQF